MEPEKHFTIRNYPNDVYCAVGQIIKAAQEWEQQYKKLTDKLNLPVDNIDNASLNRLNDALKKNNKINEKRYSDLRKVIEIRNHMNHGFFLSDFQKPFTKIESILNEALFLIFEATDVIDNMLDEISGDMIKRPTTFD